MPSTAADPAVIRRPGPTLLDAATWVGHAGWSELRLHEVLTRWLANEVDPASSVALWRARADAAERAEAWHRRLPELREFPRSDFVVPRSADVAALFDRLEELATADRAGALVAVLRGLRLGYHHRQLVAVGVADGPVAATLVAALRSTFDSSAGEPDPMWTEAVDAAGGLP